MAETCTFRIWMAGDYATAVAATREWCIDGGDCYAVAACDFVFSGGLESGVCVTRINYGRFPETEEALVVRVNKFAAFLAERLFQKSYSVEGPRVTTYTKCEGPWS